MDKTKELLEVAEKLSDLDLEQLILWLRYVTDHAQSPKFPQR